MRMKIILFEIVVWRLNLNEMIVMKMNSAHTLTLKWYLKNESAYLLQKRKEK